MKKSYFIFLFLFVYLSNHAQIEFKNHIISDERFLFREANSILPIDIDGDGDLDVFASTTNFPRNKVVWYENIDGHGRFGNQKIILNNFDNVSSIYSEDLDADGDMDLLVTSASDDTVLWYQNTDGKGSFVSHQVVDIELDGARSVSAKDLDGDGNIDIVASGSTTAREEIVWYKNVNGQGDFGAKQTITLYDSFSFFHNTFRNIVSCEDIDGDGDIDVLASSSFNSLAWYENIDGKGNFDNRNTIKGPFSGRIRSLQVKDIDGDGDMDIFSTSGLKILWNKNDGKGNFGEPKVISENSGEVESIFVEDFNNDGNMDILSVFGRSLLNDGMIIYYPGIDNQGTWGEQKIISENLKNPKMIYAADMDGDRDLDILSSSNEHRGRIDWYPNIENSGKFEAPNIISRRVSNISSLSSGDIDGDGDIDLLVSSTDKKITLYPNLDGQGYFNTQYIIDENSNIPNSTDLKDIDNDGHLDIIVAYNTKIAWKRNIEGIGNFEEERIILEYDFTDFKDVIVLDFDNDGDNDVLTLAKGSKGGLILIKNTNNGEFEKEQLITNGDLDAINVGDIDGDGDIDIVLNVNGIISWFENRNGFVGHRVAMTNPTTRFPLQIYISDIDSDGDNDIITNTSLTNVVWFENTNGLGTFGNQIKIGENQSEGISIADVDGDGDNDIITGELGISWFENKDGLGKFEESKILYRNDIHSAILKPIDIDSDGDLDFFSGSKLIPGHYINWYENFLETLNNKIDGNIHYDKNGDGCDVNDLKLSNIMLISDNGQDSFVSFSKNDGSYSSKVNTGEFTTTITSNFPDYININPVTHNSNFIDLNNNTNNLDFCLEKNQDIKDLKITMYPIINEPNPGFDTHYKIVYKNLGTVELSGNISLEYNNSKLKFLTASKDVVSNIDNQIIFDYNSLLPFETREIELNFNVLPPPINNIDDILTFKGVISPTSNDFTEQDNTFRFDQIVIGSFDPNDISVLEGSEILYEDVDGYLHYLIRFQNTGTANAINVRVLNPIDKKLDWQTLIIESTSHNSDISITNNKKIEFVFNNINLADSTTDEPNSHGYIAYKIKPKESISVGDILKNKAFIYFDFNLPIETNEVSTLIVEDNDKDGVYDNIDKCKNTPLGEIVDTSGCSETQNDDDNDGISNAFDLCPNTKDGSTVDSLGCFNLPNNNFIVKTVGETCPNENNAKIIISASKIHDYQVTLNGNNYTFSKELIVDNLKPEIYSFCITIPSESYEQCYTTNIAKAEEVSGKLFFPSKEKEVSIDIDKGTPPYKVFVNGYIVIQTNNSSFSINTSNGDLIEITTSKPCEGKFSKKINLNNQIVSFPNPTNGKIEISSPSFQKEVLIDLYNIQSQLISTRNHFIKNEKITINLKEKANGIYFAKIHTDKEIKIIKIVKQ